MLAKILHDHTSRTILVCCYINHALDQFLEDLLDVGIPEYNIVRLGGTETQRTEPLTLHRQKYIDKFQREDWCTIDDLREGSAAAFSHLDSAFGQYTKSHFSIESLMVHLEFEEPEFFEAFELPSLVDSSGMQRVGTKGRPVHRLSLLERWLSGKDAGFFKDEPSVREASRIWNMSSTSRKEQRAKWEMAILQDHITRLYETDTSYNVSQTALERKFAEREGAILCSKRIIGCTTTAAAKYSEYLKAASPQTLLVEEAGEILESHILTALGENTDQMILIGDHQ